MVAGFLFFFTFSPSFGPAFLYYQTDELGFSQKFIGLLASLNSAASVVGALIYAPLSRRMPLRRLLNWSIGVGVAGTLCYLVYRGRVSAVAIDGRRTGGVLVVSSPVSEGRSRPSRRVFASPRSGARSAAAGQTR